MKITIEKLIIDLEINDKEILKAIANMSERIVKGEEKIMENKNTKEILNARNLAQIMGIKLSDLVIAINTIKQSKAYKK